MLGFGFMVRVLGLGSWVLGFCLGFWVGFWIRVFLFRLQDFGLGFCCLGCRILV